MSKSVLVDSNVIIKIIDGDIDIDTIIEGHNKYFISVISYMEVLGFSFSSIEDKNKSKAVVSSFDIEYIDKEIADKVVEIRSKTKIKLPDAIIAGTAIVKRMSLMTYDPDFKKIKSLKLLAL